MPRQARLDTSGTLHYVVGREIERKRIFREDEIGEKELRLGGQSQRVSSVRAKVAWELNRGYGVPMAEIARHVGICTSAIGNAL